MAGHARAARGRAAHPVRDLTQAARALDRARGQLELDLGRRFRRNARTAGSWSTARCPRVRSWATDPRTSASPRAMPPCRSTGDDLDRYLRLPRPSHLGVRTPDRSVAPVLAWALRLWDWEDEGSISWPGAGRGSAGQRDRRHRGPALPPAPGRAGADQHPRSPLGPPALRHPLRRAVPPRPRGGAGLMARALAALAGREFDVLVVGGGITGAVTAWDAAQRGLSVACSSEAIWRGHFRRVAESRARRRPLSPAPGYRAGPGVEWRTARPSPHGPAPGATHAVRRADLRARDAGPGNSRRRLHPAQHPDGGPEPGIPIPPAGCQPPGSSPAAGSWGGSPRSIRKA